MTSMIWVALTVIGVVCALMFLDVSLIRRNRHSRDRLEHAIPADPEPEAWIRRGRALFAGHDLDGAADSFAKALDLTDRPDFEAQALHGLGMVDLERGDLVVAEERFDEALERNRRIDRKSGMAAQLGNLGLIARRRGDLARSETLHRRALALEEEAGNAEGVAAAHYHLGQLALARHEPGAARTHLERARAGFAEAGRAEEEKRAADLLERLAAPPSSGA